MGKLYAEYSGSYARGFRAGRLDKGLGLRLVVAWYSPDAAYAAGYQDGWSGTEYQRRLAGVR